HNNEKYCIAKWGRRNEPHAPEGGTLVRYHAGKFHYKSRVPMGWGNEFQLSIGLIGLENGVEWSGPMRVNIIVRTENAAQRPVFLPASRQNGWMNYADDSDVGNGDSEEGRPGGFGVYCRRRCIPRCLCRAVTTLHSVQWEDPLATESESRTSRRITWRGVRQLVVGNWKLLDNGLDVRCTFQN
ncbi:hypothetical protein BC826DRAFT_1060669, partial [Russula brevipes]